jgi:hypothetical protein
MELPINATVNVALPMRDLYVFAGVIFLGALALVIIKKI